MTFKEIQEKLKSKGFDVGPIDGIYGRLTRRAILAFQSSEGLKQTGQINPETHIALLYDDVSDYDFSQTPWMDEAERYIGVTEFEGEESNPVITVEMGGHARYGYNDDSIPWCGLFALAVIAAILPEEPLLENSLRAKNWCKFGQPCTPVYGAIMVFWRKNRKGAFGHVGFMVGETDKDYIILGGNQNNKVCKKSYPKKRFIEARWPVSIAR